MGIGSLVGYNAIVLEINNTKYVCESTDNNPLENLHYLYGIIKHLLINGWNYLMKQNLWQHTN